MSGVTKWRLLLAWLGVTLSCFAAHAEPAPVGELHHCARLGTADLAQNYPSYDEYFLNLDGRSPRIRVVVRNAAELRAAVDAQEGPTELILDGQNFGALHLGIGQDRLLIRSKTSGNARASFSAMRLNGRSNVMLADLDLAAPPEMSAAHVHARPFQIKSSRNITLARLRIIGQRASSGEGWSIGYPLGHGLFIAGSDGITLQNSCLELWHRGAVFRESSNLLVQGNEIRSIRSDGLNFVQVSNVIIHRNHIHNFERSLSSPDHADMLQFWTKGTTRGSHNVQITQNRFDSGHGSFTHSIFMRNELAEAGQPILYRNVEILDNLIKNAHSHGITLGHAESVCIFGNRLMLNHASTPAPHKKPQPIIRLHSSILGRTETGSSVRRARRWQVISQISIVETGQACKD